MAPAFSLIEILLVMVLGALMATSAIVGFGAVRRGRLRAGAAHIASAFRFAYVHALTTGRATRVMLDVGGNLIAIEDTDDAHVLDIPDPVRLRESAQQIQDAAEVLARDTISVTPHAPRAEFRPLQGPRGRPRPVEREVLIARLYASHEAVPREHGRGYVYFFSGGATEQAVVQLRGADGQTFSIVLHPITGRTEIFNRPVEPQTRADQDITDQQEIDSRDQVTPPP